MYEGEQDVSAGSDEAGYTPEIEVIEDEEVSEPTEPAKTETPYETAERILKEQAASDGGKDSGQERREEPTANTDETEQAEVAEIPAKVGRPKKGDDIDPPDYLSTEEKEEFKNMPRAGKRIVTNALKRHQAKFTQFAQKAANAEREAKEYNETARLYLTQNPELIERGYNGPRLLRELLAAQMMLTGPDRQKAKARYLQMGRELGFNVTSDDPELVNGHGAAPIDIASHPQFQALQAQTLEAKSYVDSLKQQQFNRQVDAITAEIRSVQQERGPNGEYLYPETHDEGFLDQAKPLVSALAKTMPYGEALKRAYYAIMGRPSAGNFSQGIQTKLPANNQNIQQRAAQAAVSVRGRSTPQSVGNTLEIPKSALSSATATAEWIINHNRRGG